MICDLTVAICAYNAETRIGMVLESLAGQETSGITWELLVIDNASTDQTARVAEEIGRKLGLPIRVLHEPEPGLSNARCKAAVEARAEVISFLDDDNAVGSDWVSQCHQFMAEHPATGIVGARVVPLFEDPARVPADFQERFAGLLSMYDQGDNSKRVRVQTDQLPVGAGMTGRTSIFRFVFGELGSATVGRKGDSLAGGEDHEAMIIAHRMGWEVWYSPELRLGHWVPARKLTDEYYWKWVVDTAGCHAWLGVLSGRERMRSRLGFCVRWLTCYASYLRLRLLGVIPKSIYPGAALARKWAAMLRSKTKGYTRVVTHYRMLQSQMIVGRRTDGVVEAQRSVMRS